MLEVQPPLATLLHGLPGVDAVAAAGDPVPPHDAHAALLSLPLLLGQALPGPPPSRLAAALRPEPGRTGLVWAGNPKHLNDRNRSLPLGLLAPLLARPGRRWVSLQLGPRQADIAAAGLAGRLEDLPHPGRFRRHRRGAGPAGAADHGGHRGRASRRHARRAHLAAAAACAGLALGHRGRDHALVPQPPTLAPAGSRRLGRAAAAPAGRPGLPLSRNLPRSR
ncbi:hypothetical protein ACFQY5_08535 [Paeniroseomonas aquatica]|uniref:hypothetical protein n=1 Tax=Paeniroseomonas aquatica TaxID=373043 RepID=UPI003611AA20